MAAFFLSRRRPTRGADGQKKWHAGFVPGVPFFMRAPFEEGGSPL